LFLNYSFTFASGILVSSDFGILSSSHMMYTMFSHLTIYFDLTLRYDGRLCQCVVVKDISNHEPTFVREIHFEDTCK